METQILDLDGGVSCQKGLMEKYGPRIFDARSWGPYIRMACGFGRFRRFAEKAAALRDVAAAEGPRLTFYGSGDFHHVTLALIREIQTPFNLLVLDNHPDWMRGVPFMHCGTWLYHAARLPQVQRIYHVGGDVDFDNVYRWMAPWKLLRERKIVVFPGRRPFSQGRWADLPNVPVKSSPMAPVNRDYLERILKPYLGQLAEAPLYISLDKDVMVQADSIVNWDSGHLALADVCSILDAFVRAANGSLAGMDVLGDWSPVRLRGLLRRVFHWTMHPALATDAAEAARQNEAVNIKLVEAVRESMARSCSRRPGARASA